MTHQTEAELLPCPFCGSRARRAKEGDWHGTGCAGAHGCPAYLSALTYRTQEEADEAWNRRAPSVPVPQFNHPAKRKLNMLLGAGEEITGYAFQNKDGRRGSIDCHGFVAWWNTDIAAPQPPEAVSHTTLETNVAAPVLMPEPVAAERRFTTFAGDRWRWCTVEHARAFGADKGYEVRYLYTEQQLRQLLADHGIQAKST